MKNRNYKKLIRKSHRYLGVFIGIQLLFWTISGLYFTWTDINEIRGDHLRKDGSAIESIEGTISPAVINEKLSQKEPTAKISSFRIVKVLDKNYFEVVYKTVDEKESIALFDTRSGELIPPFKQKEAELIATNALAKKVDVKETVYLSKEDDLGSHHEYREKPLPV